MSRSGLVTPEDITDRDVDQALRDREMRTVMEAFLKSRDIDIPLDRLSNQAVKALLADLYNAAQRLKEKEGSAPKFPEVSDELLDEVLADNKARTVLQKLLHDSGSRTPIDLMPREDQRAAVSAMLAALRDAEAEEKGGKGGGGRSGGSSKVPEVSDELLDQVLADNKARTVLQKLLKGANINTPIDLMPREEQRAAVAAMFAALQDDEEGRDNGAGGGRGNSRDDGDDEPDVPDTLVRQVFSDPDAHQLLAEVMKQNDLPGAPRDLPFEMQRAIVKMLVKQGAISFGGGGGGGAGGGGPGSGNWWPFGKKH